MTETFTQTGIDDIVNGFVSSPSLVCGNEYPNSIRWDSITERLGELDLLQPSDDLFEAVMRAAPQHEMPWWIEFFKLRGDLFRILRLNHLGLIHVNTYEMNVSDLYAAKLNDRLNGMEAGEPTDHTAWLQ